MTKTEWVSVAEAARIADCSATTIYNRIKSGGMHARYRKRGKGKARMVRRDWAESLVVGGGDTSDLQAQIEGLKARLHAAEHDRDGGIVLFSSLREQLQAAEKDRDHWKTEAIEDRTLAKEWERKHTYAVRQESQAKKEIQALKTEIQTYADTYAEGRPPAVIDRLVAAVDADPLRATTEIDAPRHAALRRIVGMWTAIKHAVMQFQPGDIAQTNNDDEEVM